MEGRPPHTTVFTPTPISSFYGYPHLLLSVLSAIEPCYVTLASLEVTMQTKVASQFTGSPSASAFRVLGLQVCACHLTHLFHLHLQT